MPADWAGWRSGLAALWGRDGLFLSLLALGLGRAGVPGLYPVLGLAYLAAVRDRFGERVLLAAPFVFLGSLWRGGAGFWTVLPATVLLLPAYGRFGRPGALLRLAVLTAAAALGGGLLPWILSGASPGRLVTALLSAGLAGGAAPLYQRALPTVFDLGRERRRREDPVSFHFLLLSLVSATLGWRLAGLPLLDVSGAYLVLGLADREGAGTGALTGTVVGTMAYLGGGEAATAGLFSLAGVLAGSFRGLGRAFSTLFFLAGAAIFLGAFHGVSGLTAAAGALLLGSGLHLALPLSRLMPPAGPEEVSPLHEFALAFEDLAKSFDEVAPAAEDLSEGRFGYLLGTVGEWVCAGCALYPECWQKDLYRNYRAFLALVVGLGGEGGPGRGAIPAGVRATCQRQEALELALRYLGEMYRLDRRWGLRLRETRGIVAEQLRGLGRILREMGGAPSRPEAVPHPTLTFRVGVAREAKDGTGISGDAYLVRELPGGKLLVVLADGMGAGPRAALESEAAVGLVGRLMGLGFDLETVLRTVNAVLLLRSPDDSFSALDLLLVDLSGGESLLYKVGSAPTLLLRDGRVEVIADGTPPIGILPEVRPEVHRLILSAGHRLLLVSDGVLGRGEAGLDYLRGYLVSSGRRDPRALARDILSGLGPAEDDRTALVIDLVRASFPRRAEHPA